MKFEVDEDDCLSFDHEGYVGPETIYLEKEDVRKMFLYLYKESIEGLVRDSYTTGIVDTQEGVAQWCDEGSLERATEILEEFKW